MAGAESAPRSSGSSRRKKAPRPGPSPPPAMIPPMQRRLFSILGNSQKLDGGAMFGNAPRGAVEALDQARRAEPHRPGLPRPPRARPAAASVLLEAGIGAFFAPDAARPLRRAGGRATCCSTTSRRSASTARTSTWSCCRTCTSTTPAACSTPYARRRAAAAGVPARALRRRRSGAGSAPCSRTRATARRFIAGAAGAAARRAGGSSVVAGERSDVLGAGYRFHRSDGHTPGLLLTEVARPTAGRWCSPPT